MPHGNLPHRHHLLLTTLAAPVPVVTLARHRRYRSIVPRFMTLAHAAAQVDLTTPTATTTTNTVATDKCAGPTRVAVALFFDVRETMRAGAVAAAGEARAEGGG